MNFNDPYTFSIFPLSDDLFIIDNLASKHNVKLTIGGPYLRVPERKVFKVVVPDDIITNMKWMICYLTGSYVNIMNMEEEFEHYIHNNNRIQRNPIEEIRNEYPEIAEFTKGWDEDD